MSSQGIAVQDRLGDTTDHAMPPGGKPGPRGSGPFLYASGTRPLAGYTIKRGVGSGGFGEVYYATSDAGKEVALKLIRRNLDTELRGMRQCLNLKHPNLLSLYDIRQDDAGDTWVVMEYMSGKCLEAELADHPQGLPLAEALAWFHGIAAGVAYLHDHGIVHRDLKPGNIFCDEGVVKVGDYGLSKFISCSRRSGHTESIGTVHYMAPEVAHGRYGKELDIYALGAILYELLTGRVPFEGESVGEVLMKHLTAQPDVSKLAEPYRSVVARALEKDPARRFATVGEMVAALPAAATAQTIPLGGGRNEGSSRPSSPPVGSRAGSPVPPLPPPRPRPTTAGMPVENTDDLVIEEPIAKAVHRQVRRMRRGLAGIGCAEMGQDSHHRRRLPRHVLAQCVSRPAGHLCGDCLRVLLDRANRLPDVFLSAVARRASVGGESRSQSQSPPRAVPREPAAPALGRQAAGGAGDRPDRLAAGGRGGHGRDVRGDAADRSLSRHAAANRAMRLAVPGKSRRRLVRAHCRQVLGRLARANGCCGTSSS